MVETIPTTHTSKIILGTKLKQALRTELRLLSEEWNCATRALWQRRQTWRISGGLNVAGDQDL